MPNVYFVPEVRLIHCGKPILVEWKHRNLSAPFWRLYWNRNPGASVVFDEHETRLEPGKVFLIPPNTPFSTRLSGRVEHFYIHFLVTPVSSAWVPGVYGLPATKSVLNLVESVSRQVAVSETPGVPTVLKAMALISLMLAGLPEKWLVPIRLDSRVEEAMRLMDASLATPLSNERLARAVAMHPNAFIRLFRAQAGVSPQDCFRRKRIDHACMRLHNSQASIKQIAEESGFCDRYHFSRAFKHIRGLSPGSFRQQVHRTTKTQTRETQGVVRVKLTKKSRLVSSRDLA